jgi:hypothetical protein
MSDDTKDLTVQEPEQIEVIEEPITLNPIDLERAEDWEDFISLWMISKDIDVRNQWFKGDIANRVVVVHGENSLSKFAEDVHEKRVTLENYRRVARAFPKDVRGYNITWTHYFLASYTDSYNKKTNEFQSEERFKWIQKANDESWSTTRLAQEIKKQNALVSDHQDIFTYYEEYLGKVGHVLLHMEKEQLTKEQAEQLLSKLMAVYNDFTTYLDTVK